MVSLLNDFSCVLLDYICFHNICHILCTCIYFYEYRYSCADSDRSDMKNISHIHYMYTYYLQCVFSCVYSNHVYSWTICYTLYTYIIIIGSDVVFFSVSIQTTFPCKSFVTDCTHVWCWLVIMWMFSDIIIVSFNLYVKATFTCIYHNRTCFASNQQLIMILQLIIIIIIITKLSVLGMP